MSAQSIERLKVGKFGGTSMANAEKFRSAADIVLADPSRRVITVSAPGNGDKGDPNQDFRVTQALKAKDFGRVWQRFDGIAADLFGRGDTRYQNVASAIDESRAGVERGSFDYQVSRGEYLSAKIFAELTGATFVDAAQLVSLRSSDEVDFGSYQRIPELLREGGLYVVPGYYGTNVNTRELQKLPDGGTDLTGAILARGLGARVYENWTDVEGVLAADPRLFPKRQRDYIRRVPRITYDEMGELSYRGAGILQVDAVGPAREAGIPINIRSSRNPSHPGTMVVEHRISDEDEGIIGIASKKGFVSFRVTQAGMNKRRGVMARLGEVFEENGVSLEQGPGGNDYVSVIFHSDQLANGTDQQVMRDIRTRVPDSSLYIVDRRGLVSVVGQGLQDELNATGISADIFTALRDARIGHGARIQAERPISSVISVRNEDTRRTVRALYGALIR